MCLLLCLFVLPAALASGGLVFSSDVRERILAGEGRAWALSGDVRCMLFPGVLLFSGEARLPDKGDTALFSDAVRLFFPGMILHAGRGRFSRPARTLVLEDVIVFAPGREWWGSRMDRVVVRQDSCRLFIGGREHCVIRVAGAGSGGGPR